MTRVFRLLAAPLSDQIAFVQGAARLIWTQTALRLVFGRVGRRTVVFKPGLVLGGDCIEIGSNSIIRYGSRLEIVRHGQSWTPKIVIGDHVNIEQNVHIVCHGSVIINDRVSITGNCAIVDVKHPVIEGDFSQKIGDNIDREYSLVEIGEGSFLGFGCTILPNVSIGRMCIVGAGSVVNINIPDYSIAAGVPARVIGSTMPSKAQKLTG